MTVRLGEAITFSAVFYTATEPHDGADLSDVTATVRNPLGIEIVTAAPAVERADGRWEYTLAAGGNSATGLYTCAFRTASDDVDAYQKDDRVLSQLPELDLADMVDGYSVREILRGVAAALLGVSSGFPTAPSFQAVDGSKARVTGAVDGAGNRSAVNLDLD